MWLNVFSTKSGYFVALVSEGVKHKESFLHQGVHSLRGTVADRYACPGLTASIADIWVVQARRFPRHTYAPELSECRAWKMVLISAGPPFGAVLRLRRACLQPELITPLFSSER